MGTMKRSDHSEDFQFIPKKTWNSEKRVRLDLPTGFKNTKLSFEAGISCLDSANSWQLEEVKEVVNRAISDFLDHFRIDVGRLKDSEVELFEKGAKDRAKVLGTMMHKLQTAEPGDILVYVYGGNNVVEIPNIRYLKKGAELLFIRDGEELIEILEFQKEPKVYSILYKAMIQVLEKFYLPIKIAQPDRALVVLQISQFLITAGNIYTAFRSTEGMINNREKEAFQELKEPSKPLSADFLSELKELEQDIKENKLRFVQEFNDAKRAITPNSLKFRDSDNYSSVKKSASYSKEFGRLPATLASAYEIDKIKDLSIEFDELTGYTSNYLETSPTSETLVGKTLTIDQNKIKRRVIHIFSNAVQDRMNLCERVLSAAMRRLPSDCAKRQLGGVEAGQTWTSRAYRELRDNPTIACMDLSNATDNLNKDFQDFSLRLVLPFAIVRWWMTVVSQKKQFQFQKYNSLDYDQYKGQPQGLLSSFTAFSLAHHVVMLLVMKRAGLVDKLASEVYMILGDDSIINSVIGGIEGNLIVQHYIDVAKNVGWDVDLSKSRITYHEDNYAYAEFAKVSILDGVIITPPPFRLLSQIVGHKDRGARDFAFNIWLAKHNYAGAKVIESCIDRWTEGERKDVLRTLMFGGIITPFLDKFQDHSISDDSLMWKKTALEYLKNYIKESIVDSVLNDREMASLDYMETYLKKISVVQGTQKGLSEIELLDKLTVNLPINHKLFYFLQRNASIEEAVKSITGLDNSKTVISSLELKEEEIDAIFTIDSHIKAAKLNVFNLDRESLKIILKQLEGLERYRLKSMYKSIGRMANSFLTIVDSYCEQLPSEISVDIEDSQLSSQV